MKLKAMYVFLVLLLFVILISKFSSSIEGATNMYTDSQTDNASQSMNNANNYNQQNGSIPQDNTSDYGSTTQGSPYSATNDQSPAVGPPTADQINNYDDTQQQQQQQQPPPPGPPQNEDLYVLKSTIIPPVCPACPTSTACPRQKPCQPCPPCARCPEPAFECKKVPNYTSSNTGLPKPVLTDFSKFSI